MGGRDQSEQLVAINRNQWSQSAGTPIDHVVVFGERHLRHVLPSYKDDYNAM
jgi:hypothetical protein